MGIDLELIMMVVFAYVALTSTCAMSYRIASHQRDDKRAMAAHRRQRHGD